MNFDISIIIPVYKAKKTIKNAIYSILKQKYNYTKPKIEIILSIDDQKNYKDFIVNENNYIRTKIVTTYKNGSGAGNARNEGFRKSKGKYIGFLDADDSYSENYLDEMYRNVKTNGIVIAPTFIYLNHKKILEFRGLNKNLLDIDDISKVPCTFHPFIKKSMYKYFFNKPSQDVYNLAKLLNEHSIKMLNNIYYRLNLRNNSYTSKKNYTYEVDRAYKYYQTKSILEKKYKVARQFAFRRILNNKYKKWLDENENKTFYEFISMRLENEDRKNLYI